MLISTIFLFSILLEILSVVYSNNCETLELEFCCVSRHLELCGPKCYGYAAKWCPKLLQSRPPDVQFQQNQWTEWTDFTSFQSKEFLANAANSAPLPSSISNTIDSFGSGDCGQAPNWRSCVSRTNSNGMFLDCCTRYGAPRGCQSLCRYGPESDPVKYADYVVWDDIFRTNRECLKYTSLITYCASQNRDNSKCCENQGIMKLKNAQRCARFCDPRRHGGLGTLTKEDLECLANWNVLMQCHESGL